MPEYDLPILIIRHTHKVTTPEGELPAVEIEGFLTKKAEKAGDFHEFEPISPSSELLKIIVILSQLGKFHPKQFVNLPVWINLKRLREEEQRTYASDNESRITEGKMREGWKPPEEKRKKGRQ